MLVIVVLLSLLSLSSGCCANSCSGHGTCNSACVCTCYNQWTDPDCSSRTCPSGLQWTGDASATDSMHQTYAVCSNVGSCDTTTGLCTCQSGFTGIACERMACPSGCNGHGACISLKRAAEIKDDRNFYRETAYSSSWEANRIFGCQCEIGYSGYACETKECPAGDDPLTTGQVDEIQVIDCTCDTCSGSLHLSFKGEVTTAIPHDASTSTVQAILENLKTIHGVSVSYDTGSTLCSAAGVSAAITFTKNPGDLPQLRLYHNGLTAGVGSVALDIVHSGRTSLQGTTSVIGTKENLPCNGRGDCDTSGDCTCYTGFSSSDRQGNVGASGDCGYSDGSVSTCPNSCSSNGVCSGASTYLCTCDDGFSGVDCSFRVCPTGKAWFAEPGESLPGFVTIANAATTVTTTADLRSYINRGETIVINGEELVVAATGTFDATNLPLEAAYEGISVTYAEPYGRPEMAHYQMTCSNRGVCDSNYGTCSCDNGFQGYACQRTSCHKSCNGNGRCLSLANLAIETDANGDTGTYTYGLDPSNLHSWDHESLFGCKCDRHRDRGGFVDAIGHDCSSLACPYGDDPGTSFSAIYYQVLEVQTITCSATGGTFQISFNGATTASIAYNADQATVTSSLEALSTIGTVTVTYDSGVEACSSGGVVITVQFDTDFGNKPLMKTTATSLTGGTSTATVMETVEGNNRQANEVQTITCTATSGAFKVSFRQETTSNIAYDASVEDIQTALTALSTIESATVTYSTGSVACSGAGVGILVNFTGNLGELPLLTTDVTSLSGGTAIVVETVKGTFENVECSNHGKCNRKTGECKCFSGYVSSNGQGSWGGRGDCSYRDALFVSS